MARKPSEPSPKSTDSKTAGDRSAERPAPAGVRAEIVGAVRVTDVHTGPAEAVGPLAVNRLRKVDGRALILYSAAGKRA
jgi:hypothetical protein